MTATTVRVTPEFQKQAMWAIASIVLFVVVYILLLLATILVSITCVLAGLSFLTHLYFLSILLGLGIISLGLFLLFFMVKFVFSRHRVDRSHLHEVTRAQEPALFALIEDVVQEVETTSPKKVYLSADTNASVFYDSSFWSMFLPIRKNLQIGLGLMNTLSRQELKAVLAHEFGHFSQRSMKVGSYVYNVNQVIFNMLYDNDRMDKMMETWANTHVIFAVVTWVAAVVIRLIQGVLRLLYSIVNKAYLALSRSMEFHADEIAAHVTGFEPLKYALLRLQLADHSFQSAIGFYDGRVQQNQKSDNIYRDQEFVLGFLAHQYSIPMVAGLPQLTEAELGRFRKSKLVVIDQWASHPSTEERIRCLEQTGLARQDDDHSLANELLQNAAETQQQMTRWLYKDVKFEGIVENLRAEDFQRDFEADFNSTRFPLCYNGYYDHKNPVIFGLDKAAPATNVSGMEELFSDEEVDRVYGFLALNNDIETLGQIADRTLAVKTFDYDGKKYRARDSKQLQKRLQLECNDLHHSIAQHDITIYGYFKHLEQQGSNQSRLDDLYTALFEYDQEFDERYPVYAQMHQLLNALEKAQTDGELRTIFDRIERKEPALREGLQWLLNFEELRAAMPGETKDRLTLYLTKDWQYMGYSEIFQANIQMLYQVVNDYVVLLSKRYYLLKISLLTYQSELGGAHL